MAVTLEGFGGTIFGDVTFTGSLIFEGATDNAYETTITVTDPTADRTISIPDADVTLVAGTMPAITGSPVNNQVSTFASAGTIQGESNLTFDGSLLTVTGNLTATGIVTLSSATIAGGTPLVFEGATANAYETSIAITDPTADRTITFPDSSGTVFFSGGTDLTVADGGTGASTFTDGGVLLGSGTGAITATAVLGDGVILIGDGSGDPATLDVGSSSGITILGTIATGVWQGTDVGVAYGGTGVSTLTDGGILLGSGAAAITATAVLADGEILIGDGSGDPVALDVGSASAITILGTIATGVWQGTDVGVAYGGTGVSSLTDGGVLLGSGSGAITAMSVLTDSQMIVGDGSGDPVAESGATLRTSIGVGTGDSPTFTGLVAGQVIVGTDGATAGDVVIDNTNNGEIIWEGSTADGNENKLRATDGAGVNTLPASTGTILTTAAAITVGQGGTGATSFTDGGVLLGSGSGAITATAVLADGEILIGDASGDPAILDVGSSTAITTLGTVSAGVWQGTDVGVAYGGTGVSTLTDGGVLLGSGGAAITAMGVLTDSQMIVGDGSGDPVAESGATLRTSIGVGTGDSPQFTALALTSATPIVFEGATANEYETSFAITDPTADRTITFKDGTGTVAFTSDISGAGLGNVSNTGTPANNQVAIFTDATTVEGDGDLTFDGTNLSVTGSVIGGQFIAGTDGATAGDVVIDNTNNGEIIWEGSTADGNENILRATDGAGVNTLPASTGTILTTAAAVSVAQGGTGATSLTDGGLLLGSGTGAITALGVAANGQIPIGDGSTDPVLATLTGTAYEVDVTNGSGSITIGLPTDVTIAGDLVVSGVGPHSIGSAVWGEAQLLVAGTFPNSIAFRVETTLQPDVGESSSGVMFLPTIQEQGSGTHASFYTLDIRPPTITGGAAALTTAATVRISDDPSAGGNNYSLLIEAGATRFGAIGANDGHVHILSPATGTSALVLEMPASATANGLLMQYNGSNRGGIYVDGGNSYLILSDADLGDNAPGTQLIAGRNTNSTNSGPGLLRLTDIDGTNYYTHSDNAGLLRTGTTAPRESTDTTNAVVGDQSSFQFHADGILNKFKVRDISPLEGLEVINKSRFTVGKYADGSYNDGEFIWPYAEESPWLMQDPSDGFPSGRSHSPISHASLNSLAIQELNEKIEDLERRLN
jgi:hypothetical protein